jgi:tetratricopeptide (TPR) repeat protein
MTQSSPDFDAFIESAWNEHADAPQAVAERLATSIHLVQTSAQVATYARLVTHVFGEHLGQWERGVDVLGVLRGLPATAAGAAAAAALSRSTAALRYASGDPDALAALPAEERVAALATAASALAGRNDFRGALGAYDKALALAQSGLPPHSPSVRALAVGGNNLAAALEQKAERDDAESSGMVRAAEAALTYWKQAGTWLEEERAEYRLTQSLLQAGDADAAVRSAQRCIDVCIANDAPAFELFFARVALAQARRAAGDADGFAISRAEALTLFERVPESERKWCTADLHKLDD